MAPDRRIRVAVVGVGHLGSLHARVYSQIDGCELVGVYDADSVRAREVAARHGARVFGSLEELSREVDAASLAVPTDLHHGIGRELLERGLHLLIEKPITETREQAVELVGLAAERSLVLQVGHVERFNPALIAASEHIGDALFVESLRLAPFNPRGTEVAVVLDLMIHDIDLVLQIIGSPVVSMDAVGVPILTDKEDLANVRLKFENGATANLTVSRVTPRKQRKIRVFQQDTYISIDCMRQSMEIHQRILGQGGQPSEIQRKKVRLKKEEPLKIELDDFLTAIIEGRTPTVTGENARDALQIAVQIGRMIHENLPKL